VGSIKVDVQVTESWWIQKLLGNGPGQVAIGEGASVIVVESMTSQFLKYRCT
jgi:hypothetical protein